MTLHCHKFCIFIQCNASLQKGIIQNCQCLNKMCIPTPAGSVNCMYSCLALTEFQQNLRSGRCINVLLLFVPSVWCSSKCPSSVCYCPDSWKPQQHKHQHLLGSSPPRSPKWSHPGVQGRKDLY